MLFIRRKEIGRLFVGIVIAIVIAVVISGFHVLITDGLPGALLVWSGAAAAAILLLPVVLRKKYETGEPLSFILLATLIGVTLKAPYVFISSRADVVDRILLGRAPEDLLLGMILILAGLSTFCAGYLVRSGKLQLQRTALVTRTVLRPLRFTLVSTVVLVVVAIAIVLFVREFGIVFTDADIAELSGKRFMKLEGSEFQASFGYQRWAISLAAILFCIAFSYAVKERGARSVLSGSVAAIAAAVAIGFAIFASSRESVVMLVAASLMIVYYARGRINVTRAALAIVLCSILLVAITVLRPAKIASDVGDVDLGGELVEITVGGRHFLDLGKTTHVAYSVPDVVPFQNGRTLVSWVFAPIPRAVWVDKPAVGVGPLLGREIFQMGTGGGVPPGFIAELYLNFHFAGVVLGMFVFGVMLRLFYDSFRPFLLAGNPNAIAMYALIVQTCSINLVNADFSKFIVELLMQVPPVLLIVMLIAGKTGVGRVQSIPAAGGTDAAR